jgi:hypothetical protein
MIKYILSSLEVLIIITSVLSRWGTIVSGMKPLSSLRKKTPAPGEQEEKMCHKRLPLTLVGLWRRDCHLAERSFDSERIHVHAALFTVSLASKNSTPWPMPPKYLSTLGKVKELGVTLCMLQFMSASIQPFW